MLLFAGCNIQDEFSRRLGDAGEAYKNVLTGREVLGTSCFLET